MGFLSSCDRLMTLLPLSFYLITIKSFCYTLSPIEYWVTPDTISTCPAEIPQHQCVTVSDLVSYSTNNSLNQGRNITIHFLPGIHTPRVEGKILIAADNNANLEAKIEGEEKATIDCSLNRIAFIFHQVFHAELRGLNIEKCSFKTGIVIHSSSMITIFELNVTEYTSQLYKKEAAIAIIMDGAPTHNTHLLFNKMVIGSSLGYGLLVVQFSSSTHSNIHITESSIHSSNVCTQKNLTSPFGGNIFILVDIEGLDFNAFDLTVTNSCHGCFNQQKLPDLCPDVLPEDLPFCKHEYFCGGLRIIAIETFTKVVIQDSMFRANEAVDGGGFYFISTGTSENLLNHNMLEINNSIFVGNKAGKFGGGIQIVSKANCECSLSMNIESSKFDQNFAKYSGGAISLDVYSDTDKYIIEKCVFTNNTAGYTGAALTLYDLNVAAQLRISQCLLRRNWVINPGGGVVELINAGRVRLDSVNITESNSTALYVMKSSVFLTGTTFIRDNYAVRSNGGGIHINCGNKWYFPIKESKLKIYSDGKLHLLNNKADGMGGGIYITGECSYIQNDCPVVSESFEQGVVSMMNNTAELDGKSIFGGNFDECINYNFWSIFNIEEKDIFSTISSSPRYTYICSEICSFPWTEDCCSKQSHSITIFLGQAFTLPLVCATQMGYSSSCIIRTMSVTKGTGIADEHKPKVLDARYGCKNFSFEVLLYSSEITFLTLTLNPEFKDSRSGRALSDASLRVDVRIKDCPPGFTTERTDNNAVICNCSHHLQQEGIICNINSIVLHKPSRMWIGNYSGDITAHRNCPLDYCKNNFTVVNPYEQQNQCEFKRSGVLCGACQPTLSLMLGSSQCEQCSNLYLFLLIPFALAGLVLVLLLLKCNLTVSTGTINGLIFYANIVQATKTALFSNGSKSIFINILSVFIAWLNLDLGIETCFVEGLNTYYRTWLQFVFPLYIWSLVGTLILVSRYSITVSRWIGSNTVPVLATLFLLSYAKLLRVTFDAFASTSLTDANGTMTLLWLLDGDYVFLQWPHSLLFTAALVTLLGHIVPFTALLLMSPTLQRYSHHKPLRWVNRLKPLLDAYQGPYKNKRRYWTGILLVVRLVILTVIALNVTGNKSVNLFCITTVLTIVLLFMWLKIGQLYSGKIPHILEVFFMGNLQLYSLSSTLLLSAKINNMQAQEVLTLCMVGSSMLVFMLIIIYHCYKRYLSKKIKCPKLEWSSQQRKLESDSPVNSRTMHSSSQSTTLPTTTVVELEELLLTED